MSNYEGQKPYVGQPVWLTGLQRHMSRELIKHVVVKVGRKYFEVGLDMNDPRPVKFHLDTFREATKYSPLYAIYLNEQDYYDEQERNKLIGKIRNAFNHWGSMDYTLDQLRRIHAIIQEGKSDGLVTDSQER